MKLLGLVLRRASPDSHDFPDRIAPMKMSALLSRNTARPGLVGTARVDHDIDRLLLVGIARDEDGFEGVGHFFSRADWRTETAAGRAQNQSFEGWVWRRQPMNSSNTTITAPTEISASAKLKMAKDQTGVWKRM